MNGERILVIGNNVRNIVQSAAKSGYKVYALTKFIDSDLILFAERVFLIEDENTDWVRKRGEELSEILNARVVLASGYEDLHLTSEILGSDPSGLESVLNKLKFYRTLERAGLPHPEVLRDYEGDCIVKPIRGGGGERILLAPLTQDKLSDYLIQRLIRGFPCSASLIVGKETTVIALNEIIAGWGEMNAFGFRYVGNITPLVVDKELEKKLRKLAIEVVNLFDLKGSIGVDFVVDERNEPYILEINPRFQGSLDSVEWSHDIFLFKLHMDALSGRKVNPPDPKRVAGRAIYFADRETLINHTLTGNPFYADIPPESIIYQKDDPVVSILASGNSRTEVLKRLIERKNLFLGLQNLS
jgi:hypothetical protein